MSSKHTKQNKKYVREIKSLEKKRDKLIKTINKNKKTILSNLDYIIERLPEKKRENEYHIILAFRLDGGYREHGASPRYMAASANPSIVDLRRLTLIALSGVKINDKDIELFYRILHNWIYFRMHQVEYHHNSSAPDGKEYFLCKKEIEELKQKINEEAEKIIDFYFQYEIDKYYKIMFQRLSILSKRKKYKLIQKFLDKNGKYFYRELTPDKNKYKVITFEEMEGRYGWFRANYKYKLDVYYTGYYLSKDKFVEFLKEHMHMEDIYIDSYLEDKQYNLLQDFWYLVV